MGNSSSRSIVDAKKLKHFDKMMQTFVDSFVMGYVDLDDMMSNDLLSFQPDLLHFLTERFGVKKYAKRLGCNMGDFDKRHRKGNSAEAAQLKSLLKDPRIVFLDEWRKGSTWVNAFKSRAKGYRIYQIARRTRGENVGGKMYFKPNNGKMVLLADHLRSLATSP